MRRNVDILDCRLEDEISGKYIRLFFLFVSPNCVQSANDTITRVSMIVGRFCQRHGLALAGGETLWRCPVPEHRQNDVRGAGRGELGRLSGIPRSGTVQRIDPFSFSFASLLRGQSQAEMITDSSRSIQVGGWWGEWSRCVGREIGCRRKEKSEGYVGREMRCEMQERERERDECLRGREEGRGGFVCLGVCVLWGMDPVRFSPLSLSLCRCPSSSLPPPTKVHSPQSTYHKTISTFTCPLCPLHSRLNGLPPQEPPGNHPSQIRPRTHRGPSKGLQSAKNTRPVRTPSC